MNVSACEYATIRDAAEASMLDTCQIGTRSGTQWGASAGADTWTYSSAAVACGVNQAKSNETLDGAEVTITDTEIRLPHGTAITAQNRIKVTHRHGAAITAQYYAVIGAPREGISALVCNCKRLTGGSNA